MTSHKQHGIALFTTLILLVVISLASVLLVRNMGFDNKITGAFADRVVSEGEVSGAVDELINTARAGGNNPFVDDESNYPQQVSSAEFSDVANEIELIVESQGACLRSSQANSQNLSLVCRRFIMNSSLDYSRSGAGQNEVATGVVHPLTQ